MKTTIIWLCSVFLWVGCEGPRTIATLGDDPAPTDEPSQDTHTCVYPEGGCHSVEDCPPGYTACIGCDPDPCFPELNGCYGRCIRAGQSGCQSNDDCAPDQFCSHQTGCTDTGECTQRPAKIIACDMDGPRVCGCDGKTYDCKEQAWGAGSSVARVGLCGPPSCKSEGAPFDVSCAVVNNCCGCQAVDAANGPFPEPCDNPNPCSQLACQGWGIDQPVAYCVAGQCLLADQGNTCESDADCTLHNDCCLCAALPNTATRDPASCPANCEVPRCQALSWSEPSARCVEGQCRVVVD